MKSDFENRGAGEKGLARQSKAARAAETIKQRIKKGEYRPGDFLPSLRALSAGMQLTLPVVQRAVRQLEREGILESHHGVGIRILDGADCGATPILYGFIAPQNRTETLNLHHAVEEAMDARSNLCLFKDSANDPHRERREIERLIGAGVSGLLIWPVDGDENSVFLEEVAAKLPTVFVQQKPEGGKAPAVVLDYSDAARRIARQLNRLRKKRALVAHDPQSPACFEKMRLVFEELSQETPGVQFEMWPHPIEQLVKAASDGDYQPADRCFKELASAFAEGNFDALFSPYCSFFDNVFAASGRNSALQKVHCVTLRHSNGPALSRNYHELKVEEWLVDQSEMLARGANILQDMTMTRRAWTRTLNLPIRRK